MGKPFFAKKKKVKDIASDLLPNSTITGIENDDDWKNISHARKNRLFISQNLCPYFRYLYGLVKEKRQKALFMTSGFLVVPFV